MSTIDLSQVWPDWKIEKLIGKGSYGAVYQAVRLDHGLTSHAAIKVISLPQDPYEIEQLRGEGFSDRAIQSYYNEVIDKFISEIQHMENFKGIPNIVIVDDYKVIENDNSIGWTIYIRMELLIPLTAYQKYNSITEQMAINLGIHICSALEICEKQKIIHRDIKPQNIFINDFGFFKLGDFGVARTMHNITHTLSQRGTPDYMAPEISRGFAYDGRADIYSLGIVLYRLLNRNWPPFIFSEQQYFRSKDRSYALELRLKGEDLPAPCEASPAMTEIILKACAFDPEDRFANATEMKQMLKQHLKDSFQQPISEDDVTVGSPDADTKTASEHQPTLKDIGISILQIIFMLICIVFLFVATTAPDKRDDQITMTYMGITTNDIFDTFSDTTDIPDGAYVDSIETDRAADLAGIESQDIITEFNGNDILYTEHLAKQLQEHSAGDIVPVVVARINNGTYEYYTFTVTLEYESN